MTDRDSDCIFCKIAAGEFGTTFLVESDNVVAFDDISPAAPVHVQVIPRRHIASARDLGPGDGDLLAELFDVANKVTAIKGIDTSGYRLVTNTGPDSGQEVFHLHIHVLGGKKLGRLA
jgi:histidine triad (HIT) family protein